MMQAKSGNNDEAKPKVAAAASPPKRKDAAGSRRCADAVLVIQEMLASANACGRCRIEKAMGEEVGGCCASAGKMKRAGSGEGAATACDHG